MIECLLIVGQSERYISLQGGLDFLKEQGLLQGVGLRVVRQESFDGDQESVAQVQLVIGVTQSVEPVVELAGNKCLFDESNQRKRLKSCPHQLNHHP